MQILPYGECRPECNQALQGVAPTTHPTSGNPWPPPINAPRSGMYHARSSTCLTPALSGGPGGHCHRLGSWGPREGGRGVMPQRKKKNLEVPALDSRQVPSLLTPWGRVARPACLPPHPFPPTIPPSPPQPPCSAQRTPWGRPFYRLWTAASGLPLLLLQALVTARPWRYLALGTFLLLHACTEPAEPAFLKPFSPPRPPRWKKDSRPLHKLANTHITASRLLPSTKLRHCRINSSYTKQSG